MCEYCKESAIGDICTINKTPCFAVEGCKLKISKSVELEKEK